MRCTYILDNGEQCSRTANPNTELCSQHLDVALQDLNIEVDLSLPVENFAILHTTTFNKLSTILEEGSLRPDKTYYDMIYTSFIFPGDKLTAH
jgi:hypothetical protein